MAIKGSSPKKPRDQVAAGQAEDDAGKKRHEQTVVHHGVGKPVAYAKNQIERCKGEDPGRHALPALRSNLLIQKSQRHAKEKRGQVLQRHEFQRPHPDPDRVAVGVERHHLD